MMDMLGFGMRVAAGAGMCFASHAAEIRIEAPKRTCDWDLAPLVNFTDATSRLQRAIDEVFRAGGGRVVVGCGFYPITGSAASGDLPLSFSMANCRLSFSKPQTEVFSASNVRAISLSNVTISGVSAPLIRTWDGRPEVRLSNAKGAAFETAHGSGVYKCPMR